MAEPRRPRVIKTRPGAVRTIPAGPPRDAGATGAGTDGPTAVPGAAGSGGATAAPADGPVAGASLVDASTVAGAVRATSSKVSVMAVDSTPQPAAGLDSKTTPSTGPDAAPAGGPDAAGRAARLRSLLTRRDKPAREQDAQKAPRPGEPTAGGGATVLAFPEPEYKRRRRLVAWAAAAVVAVLAAVMAVALYSPVLAVKNVVFEGNSLVSTETLEASLAPLVGTPLPQITDGQVSGLLQPIVQVKSTRIQARPPATLVVQLVERVPVALLKNGEEYVLVDQDGVQLGATADQAAASLPLIDGGKAVIGEATFQAMTAVLANLPQSILKQLANASASSPDAVELKLTDGRNVIWGSPSDMELKAQVLQALLNAPPITPEAGKPAPAPAKVFDVSAPRHPVTR